MAAAAHLAAIHPQALSLQVIQSQSLQGARLALVFAAMASPKPSVASEGQAEDFAFSDAEDMAAVEQEPLESPTKKQRRWVLPGAGADSLPALPATPQQQKLGGALAAEAEKQNALARQQEYLRVVMIACSLAAHSSWQNKNDPTQKNQKRQFPIHPHHPRPLSLFLF